MLNSYSYQYLIYISLTWFWGSSEILWSLYVCCLFVSLFTARLWTFLTNPYWCRVRGMYNDLITDLYKKKSIKCYQLSLFDYRILPLCNITISKTFKMTISFDLLEWIKQPLFVDEYKCSHFIIIQRFFYHILKWSFNFPNDCFSRKIYLTFVCP